MPTVMTHAVVGIALAQAIAPEPLRKTLTIASALCAMLPDVDVLSFLAGIPYNHMFGHRGFTHSIPAALAIGAIGGLKNMRVALCLFIATLSHGLLDALTNGGLGVGFLIPFSAERYFFPWTPIQVSPIGLGFFSTRGLAVFASELLWVWLPSITLLALWRAGSKARGAGFKPRRPASDHAGLKAHAD